MHVDVHAGGVESDKQHTAREFFGSAVRGKRLLNGGACRFALDVSRVDKEILIIAVGSDVIGSADKALDRNAIVVTVHLDQSGGKILAEYRPDGAFQITVTHSLQLQVPVNNQPKGNFGVRERNFFHVSADRHGLGHVTLEKLATCGHVGKQVLGYDGSSHRTAALYDIHNLSAVDVHLRTKRGIRSFGKDAQAGNSGNGRQSLTAKSQGGNAVQILCLADLTGCVATYRHGQILGRHAVPVIGHAHKGHATVLNFHSDT